MFKSYTALAAAMMLATAAVPAIAEPLHGQIPQMGRFPTNVSVCAPITPCNATSSDACATFRCNDATCGIICCEYGICGATGCQAVSGGNSCLPTAVPQPTAMPTPSAAPQPTREPAATQAPSTGDDYTTHSPSAQEVMMLNLLNQDRAANGLSPLALDPELSRIARIKSEDMRDKGYFAHESPTYGRAADMLRRFGYRFSAAGENIAHHATVEKAQAAFMSSQGHRRNILSANWEKVGIGVCYDRSGYIYATQLFVR